MPARSFIADRAHAVDASGIRRVFDLAAKLADPINLSIGLPDFDVPDVVKTAAHRAIDAGHNRYTPTQGIAPLRERLRSDLTSEYGRDVGDVLITSGVSGALLLAMMAIINPGDEVVFLDPYFVMYKHLLTLVGGVPVVVDSHPDFRFPADAVDAAVTDKTKVLILNSPSNPTGVVMREDELKAAVDVARRHGLLILSDEIYEPFLYDGGLGLGALGLGEDADAADKAGLSSTKPQAPSPKPRLYSPLSLYEHTLVLRGFSKSHAMTGWRVGYVYGQPDVVAQMTKLQQYTFVCAPSPFQDAALAALDVDMSEHVAAYARKRDLVYGRLEAAFEVVRPGGAFYIYPKVPAGRTATAFVEAAIARNVLIIPGNVFSRHDTHFRISYATTDEKLARGCDVLCDLV